MVRTILIVDDIKIDRQILTGLLSEEYSLLSADNGVEALRLLRRKGASVSAVILDLVMPVMDGFAVLQAIQDDPLLRQIPVLVATVLNDDASREKAVSLGAYAFVEKPYNKTLLLHTLQNCIRLRETAAVANSSRFDELTGLLNRNAFFAQAAVMISEKAAGFYVLSCFDVNGFKVINDQFGIEQGDLVLRYIGRVLQESFSPFGGICCRIAADDFAILYPCSILTDKALEEIHAKADNPEVALPPFSFCVGRYIINDLSLSVGAMYDRAILALNSVKGRYDTCFAEYDESMRLQLLRDREISNQKREALLSGQFEPWLQPQYNHETGALIGAEVLVRWRHPEKQIIPACDFIPVFERSGFIYEMDRYIWEQTCILLRKWVDWGEPVLPLSVNVSRYDILHGDCFEVLTQLLEKYKLPVELLRLEVTESAFSESTEIIVATIKRLVDYGFTVEIDDFGSGYSSLNILKDVPASVLKLDMGFLESVEGFRRGGSILESVIRMARRLGMAVIAEGVETKEQADFLRSIGCNYLQGYLYAKPMPAADYEALIKGHGQESELASINILTNLDNFSFWDPASIDTLIFNSFVGGACIFEYYDGKPQLLRINEKYQQVLGSSTLMTEDILNLDFTAYITPESKERFVRDLEESVQTKKEVVGEYVFLDLPGCPHETRLYSTMRVIATIGKHYLVYCMSENVSQRYQAYADEHTSLLDNLPCGAGLYILNKDGTIRSLYLNKRYRTYIRRDFSDLSQAQLFSFVHPDDIPRLQKVLRTIVEESTVITCDFRIKNKKEEYVPFHVTASIVERKGDSQTFCATFTPISAEEFSYSEMLPLALASVLEASSDMMYIKDKNLRYICCNPPFAAVYGYADEEGIIGKTDYDLLEKQIADTYTAADMEIFETKQAKLNYEAIIPNEEDALHYIVTSKYPLMDPSGNVIGIYGITRDVTNAYMANDQFKLLSDSLPGGIATFALSRKKIDFEHIRLTYFSDSFCRLLGYTRAEFQENCGPLALQSVLPEDAPGLLQQLRNLIENKVPVDYTFRIHLRDGGLRYINIKATAVNHLGNIVTLNAIFLDVTAQRDATEQLRISQEAYRLALQHTGSMILRYSIADRILTIPSEIAAVYGLSETCYNVPYTSVEHGAIAPESEKAYIAFYEEMIAGGKIGSAVFQLILNGNLRWMEFHYTTIFSSAGAPVSAIISAQDITEQREREAVYAKWQQSLRERTDASFSLFFWNLSADTALQPAKGSLLRVNPFAYEDIPFNLRISGYALEAVEPEDRELFVSSMNHDTLLSNYYRGKRTSTLEYREALPKKTRWLRLTIELVQYPNSADIAAYILFEDIDESKQAALLTQTMAQTDPLTGLLNRNAFIERTEKLLLKHSKDSLCALLMLDLDNFKQINDAFGHPAGDSTLTEIAEKLHTVFRKNDLICRFGGDEFLVFLCGISNIAAIEKKAKQICKALLRQFSNSIRLSASIGIAICPNDGNTFDALYHRADRALYRAKAIGKNNYVFYIEGMENAALPPDISADC